MKKLSIIFIALTCALLTVSAQDYSKFGFKGKVRNAQINHSQGAYQFSQNGSLTSITLEALSSNKEVTNLKVTKTGFTGTVDGKAATLTVKGGKLAGAVFTDSRDYSHNVKYTYGKDGFLSKIVESRVWYTSTFEHVESSAKIDQNGADYYLKLYQKETNPTKKAEYLKKYQAAVSGAKVNVTGGGVREKKEKHSETYSVTFSNYKTDEHGNWITRDFYVLETSRSGSQNQTVTYDPEYISEYLWNKLEPNGNLQEIEAFAKRSDITATYKTKATNYWNERILAKVEKVYSNAPEQLCKVASSPVASPETSSKAMSIVRESLYNDKVMKENDFRVVEGLAYLKIGDVSVFDESYRNRIEERAKTLYNDSLKKLTEIAQQAYDSQRYADVAAASANILQIDPVNSFAIKLRQESEYKILQNKEQAQTVTARDYKDFFTNNPTSQHVDETRDKFALLASKDFNTWNYEEVYDASSNSNIQKTVKSRHDSYLFNKWKGKFVHVGFDIEGSMGVANTVVGAGVRVRLGHFANYVNFEVGAQYNYCFSTKGVTGRDKDLTGGFYECQYISVPVDLHINFVHDWDYAWYIGLGADLGVSPLAGKFNNKPVNATTSEKEIVNKDLFVMPKLSIGYTGGCVETEFFINYDLDNQFNEKYIKNKFINRSDEKIYKSQIKREKFFDKVRFGLALRFLF